MNKLSKYATAAALMGALSMGAAFAADKPEDVPGWNIMTSTERSDYQKQIDSLKTDAERDAFREEHRQNMQARAKELGVSLEGEGSGSDPAGGAPAAGGTTAN